MHVTAKRTAFLGILLAITVILIILSGIIEINTLFLLALAAFCIGIAVREYGLRAGMIFFIAANVLGFVLAPVKMYCLTFFAFGLYIYVSELGWRLVYKMENSKLQLLVFWIIRYVIFNIIYIPILVFAPHLIGFEINSTKMWMIVILGGQVGLFIFEEAYCSFQEKVYKSGILRNQE